MHKNVRGFLLCLLLLGFCFPLIAELLAGVEHNPSESETRAKARAWLSEHIGVDLTSYGAGSKTENCAAGQGR